MNANNIPFLQRPLASGGFPICWRSSPLRVAPPHHLSKSKHRLHRRSPPGRSRRTQRGRTQPEICRWVAEFSTSARATGIDEATLQIAFGDVRFLPRVIAMDRAQPEFTRTVWDYLDSALSTQRIARGQDKLLLLRPEVDAIAARYGVPTEVLVAIWGMESNYGSFVGDIPTIDALATLGFEGRREQWARGQLLAALKILQSGDIGRAQMVGSWAGAMGQTQFLPSNFLAYAVDADGDGRRDIWDSVADVMASTAKLWRARTGEPTSRGGWRCACRGDSTSRAPMPAYDNRRRSGRRRGCSLWTAHRCRRWRMRQSCFRPVRADRRSSVRTQLPRNPALQQFDQLCARSYALLAQQLAGGPAVQTAWPRDLQALTSSQVMALQTALNARGFDSGTPDGAIGPATRRGVRQYQRSLNLPADGYPTLDLLQRLQ